jgi:hypothetical protein
LVFVSVLCGCAHAAASSPSRELQCGPDINRDGVVDLFDLIRVAVRYGMTSQGGLPPEAREDTNGDGVICISDLVCVSSNYGRGATPPPTRTPTATQTPTATPTASPTATQTATPTPFWDC